MNPFQKTLWMNSDVCSDKGLNKPLFFLSCMVKERFLEINDFYMTKMKCCNRNALNRLKDPGLWQGSQPGGLKDSALWLGWNTGLLNCGRRSWIGEAGSSAWWKSSHTVAYVALKAFGLARPALKKKHQRRVNNVQTHQLVSSSCSFVVNIHDNDPARLNRFIPMDLQLPDESIILQPSQAHFKPAELDRKNSTSHVCITVHSQSHNTTGILLCEATTLK